ncbi:dTMP kinase [Streptomyces sp. NPDC101150]|uniref:dTMP kinase n=1 Tax=Streptomyces sp. NPDC101150 TaxID=3366114 RepID=UPI00380E7584
MLTAPYVPDGSGGERKGAFVVLEGVSGVGKSTLTALLGERLNATTIHTLPAPHTGLSAAVNTHLNALPQFAFYLSGLLHASDRIRDAITRGPVVADRYLSSVVACHAAVHSAGLDQVRVLIRPFLPYLIQPDATFYLNVSNASLLARMGSKTDLKRDDTELFNVPGRLAALRKTFTTVALTDPTAVMLDTDDRSPDDLAVAVIEHLEEIRA